MYFSLLLCIPSVAKVSLSCCKGVEQGKQSSDGASPAAPLKHRLCSSLPRPQPDDVCGPRRAALWGAEQLPGLSGTVLAAGTPRYSLGFVSESLHTLTSPPASRTSLRAASHLGARLYGINYQRVIYCINYSAN